jgi:hypothetical protein
VLAHSALIAEAKVICGKLHQHELRKREYARLRRAQVNEAL